MVAEHITNIPCDKHSGKRAHTQMLIVHSIESPLVAGYAVSMAHNWLGKRFDATGRLIEASSNVIVSPDTLVRSVHKDYAAWHASWANVLSVGYEQAGYAAFAREQWLTPGGRDQIDRLAREMAQDAQHYGIPLRWLTAAEVNAIANGDRTIKGLVTHAVIDPGNRTDPGSQYPYDVLLDRIKSYAGGAAPQSADITPIPQEDTLSQAEVHQINTFTQQLVNEGIGTAVREIRANAAAVANDVKKEAYGTKVFAQQVMNENGDRIIMDARGQIAGLTEAIKQLAQSGGSTVDLDGILNAAKDGAAQAIAEGVVKVDISIAKPEVTADEVTQ